MTKTKKAGYFQPAVSGSLLSRGIRFAPRQLGVAMVLSLLAFAVPVQLALGNKDKHDSPVTEMEEQKRAAHALNRLTFGPRPGDIDRVIAMGVDKWIDQQLHPDKIDDQALDARLAAFRTLRMSTREIVENFPPEPVIRAIAEGKQSLPSDPTRRVIYQAQLERYQEKLDRKQAAANSEPATAMQPGVMSDDDRARRREGRMSADQTIQELLDVPAEQRMRTILKMSPEEERELTASLKGDKRDQFMADMSPQQRETLMALNNPQQVVIDELGQSKLLRATYSARQLPEVMSDFWFNHFNVFIGKDADRYLLTSYERDVIRP